MKLEQNSKFTPNLTYNLKEYLQSIATTMPVWPSPYNLQNQIFGSNVKLPIKNIKKWYPFAWFGYYATRCVMEFATNGKREDVFNLIAEVDLSELDHAIKEKGAILLGSHLGPYSAVDILFEAHSKYNVKSVTSNPFRTGNSYINAQSVDDQKKALIKSLLHTRSKGILRIAVDGRLVGDQFFDAKIFQEEVRLSKGPWHLISHSDCPVFWTTCSFKKSNAIEIKFEVVNIKNENEYLALCVSKLESQMANRPQDIGFRSGNVLWHKGMKKR